jgi:arylsulfatase A-like enzyme
MKTILGLARSHQRRASVLALVTVALLATSCGGSNESDGTSTPPPVALGTPNIIFILQDDQGWGDVGYHGSIVQTPTIDRMARQGVELNRYYTYAVCSPTRAALMSGRSSLETGVDAPISTTQALPMNLTLLPQYMKAAGYQTVMIGKWHLGQAQTEYQPHRRGFDHFYGFLSGFQDHYTRINAEGRYDWQRNGVEITETGHSTDLMAEETLRMIKARDKTKPLFMYLAFDAPHTPLQAPEAYLVRNAHITDTNRRIFAAMLQQQDDQIARILATLQAEGMADNTLIVWASDNGHQNNSGGSSGGLRGLKGTSFEGGQRVPALAYWPGTLQAGRKLEAMVSVHDWFPTLIKLAGGTPPTDALFPGRDVMPLLRGEGLPPGKTVVLGNRNNRIPDYYESAYDLPWKLVRVPTFLISGTGAVPQPPYAKTVLLYNVVTDPNETTDLAAANPDIVTRLLADLDAAPRAPSTLSEWPVNFVPSP